MDTTSGDLSMEVDGEVVRFNIYESMRYPSDSTGINNVDAIEKAIVSTERKTLEDVLRTAEETEAVTKQFFSWYDVNSVILTNESRLVPSTVQAPKVELKELPEHLKYIFLGEGDTLPVIIKKDLELNQEQRLASVLKENKTAIGWTLGDIKGISPTVCMHRILLEDGSKPVRQPQRRVNPQMLEAVQKEVQKLLDAGVIYPISDSQWVSPVHMVPKKAGITVEENDKGELVPKRVQSGWRMCIDYRKLNAATRKNHFPLPFINQMLDRLAGKPFFCFLDGYSGYNQIPNCCRRSR